MKRILGTALIALVAVMGLTACMGDDDGDDSAASQRRSAALGASVGSADHGLVIAGLTPAGQEIKIESFSWGVANPSTFGATGLASGKAQVSDIQILKTMDETSPLLVGAVTTGKAYASATIKLRPAAAAEGEKAPATEVIYELTNVIVNGVSQGGAKGQSEFSESVTLAFQKIKYTGPKGAAATAPSVTWDAAALTKA